MSEESDDPKRNLFSQPILLSLEVENWGVRASEKELDSDFPFTELTKVFGFCLDLVTGKDLSLRNRDSMSVGRAEAVKPEQLMAETCSNTLASCAWEMILSMADSSESERSGSPTISVSRKKWVL